MHALELFDGARIQLQQPHPEQCRVFPASTLGSGKQPSMTLAELPYRVQSEA